MSRFIQVLAALVIILAGLQWGVPRWVSGKAAAAIARTDGGVAPSIALTAMPFWIIAQGRFQDVYVNAKGVTFDGLKVDQAIVNWQNGEVSVPALERNALVVKKPGRMSVTVVLDGPALGAFLATEGPIRDPVVTIASGVMTIQGKVSLGGVVLPLNTQGTLTVSPDKTAILFHPTSIDGIALPLLTDLQIFQISQLHLPVQLVIQSVTLSDNQLIVKAGTP
ncbi:LmeA family phospholipid-binding protein [Sulfobacillus sp. hq2]|uniref:LmeA family phospholipid-binding protein n=1 Tax=Sulfobacillus TaxID=28033 RepID=UPI000CD1A2CB|nr:LmeA family phospholipid-binding protein [Sulfobacillus sp. hq2]POB09736.1 hypothetical protein CO251_12580 [Sulfobacillus sp. hq2]